jgi:hypothetical protein
VDLVAPHSEDVSGLEINGLEVDLVLIKNVGLTAEICIRASVFLARGYAGSQATVRGFYQAAPARAIVMPRMPLVYAETEAEFGISVGKSY